MRRLIVAIAIAIVAAAPGAPAADSYGESCTTLWFTLGANPFEPGPRALICDGHGGFAQTYRLTTRASIGSIARFELVAKDASTNVVAHLSCAFLAGVAIDCGEFGIVAQPLNFDFSMPSAGGSIEIWGEDAGVPGVAFGREGSFCFELRTPPRDSLNC